MNTVKSIGAGFAGIVTGVVLSLGTDYILETTGFLPHHDLWVSPALILFVLFYRTVYNILGTYLAARLAPSHPMRLALTLGLIGTIVCVSSAIATKDMNLGPSWYAWALAALSLPSSWYGGRLATRTPREKTSGQI